MLPLFVPLTSADSRNVTGDVGQHITFPHSWEESSCMLLVPISPTRAELIIVAGDVGPQIAMPHPYMKS